MKMKTLLDCYQVNSHETMLTFHLPAIGGISIALCEEKQPSPRLTNNIVKK